MCAVGLATLYQYHEDCAKQQSTTKTDSILDILHNNNSSSNNNCSYNNSNNNNINSNNNNNGNDENFEKILQAVRGVRDAVLNKGAVLGDGCEFAFTSFLIQAYYLAGKYDLCMAHNTTHTPLSVHSSSASFHYYGVLKVFFLLSGLELLDHVINKIFDLDVGANVGKHEIQR